MSLVPAAVLAYGLLVDPPSGISFERSVKARNLRTGETVAVKVRLRVEKGAGTVFVGDALPPGFALVKGSNRQVFFKHVGKPLEVEYEYTLKALKRGRHVISPVEVVGMDLLQMGRTSYAVFGDEVTIEVSPDFVPTRRFVSRKLRVRENRPSSHRSKMGPISNDFREIREYRSGDPIKFINWKATARLNEPLVNEYEPEGRAKVMIYLDTTETMGVGTVVSGALEAAVSLTLSLLSFLLRNDFKVGLYLVGSRKLVTPRTGVQALSTFSKLLLHAGPSLNYESLELAVERSRAVLKGTTALTLFITNITPYNIDEVSNAVREVMRFARSRVVVVDINPYPQIDGTLGDLAGLHKRSLGDELGVSVVHWNPLREGLSRGTKKVLWVMLREAG
ncbi:DUF58 domain-containing protein [Thermococcus sp. M36]|nr:DUF58 domain-containing protein [Thermococcus sp. M36]NJE04983.1 DUF58 domain-containing protein [Thermococcus sp. M36]